MKDKIKKEVEEKKTYFKYMRLMAGGACYLLFTLLAVYVGGWLMFLEPLKGSYCIPGGRIDREAYTGDFD